MKGFWVIALLLGFIIGSVFGSLMQESMTNKEAIKSAVISYCNDTNQLDCTNQCRSLDLPNCQIIGQTVVLP